MSEVDEVAAKSLKAFVAANCTHVSMGASLNSNLVCRPCAIDWATRGCFAAVQHVFDRCVETLEAQRGNDPERTAVVEACVAAIRALA